ncbi:TRPM2 [Mytilus edulis]|uniref:TRPM2 n=1 Tax=Mytilus edulis TaxID=6550 RepID=A0A8S3Q893_MYTED|nr:TRPM2 [Mytilus edulis]
MMFVHGVDSKTDIADHLYQSDVLSTEEKEEICNSSLTQQESNRLLYNKLIRKGGDAYTHLLEAVRHGEYPDVASEMENTELSDQEIQLCQIGMKKLKDRHEKKEVKHTNVTCDECYTYPLRGIRWKCLHCDSYDLCTVCYMADEHNVSHIFSRIKVRILKGVVLVIIEDVIEVQWLTNHKRSRHNILELQCEDRTARQFYPDHLPILGKDTLGYLDVDFSHNNIAQKIQVNIRYRIEKEQTRSYKPVLYLIFANNQDTEISKNRCTLMDEAFEYSKRTKLPCHVIGKKVLFLHGSPRAVCIHPTTNAHTIKELVKKGFRIFERGDTNTEESEIKYFIRMAEYVLDEKVLPVIISIRNGGLTEDVLISASILLLPIIRLKKSSPDVTILTFENGSIEKATEYMTNLKTPWTVRKSETLIAIKNAETSEEISAINEVQSNLDFEALICHVVIGVSISNRQNVYDLTTAFACGLRADLTLSRLTYLPTDWKEKHYCGKKFYSGATQLIDTGFVRIRHILVGCKILQDVSDDKKNEQIQRETSQRLKLYFTERATLITGFIYEATSNNDSVENELGESVNHAGRLLVNHGYLEDAIKTKNKAFLDNKTVTDILNKMWYGEEKSSFRKVGLFILLALIHPFVMPILMINITAPPLKWFYQKYNLPFMKAFIQMLGYLTFLLVYSYMLLFKFKEIYYTHYALIGWMSSLGFNELKQAIVSARRKRLRRYICNVWNLLDWAVMIVYACGMALLFEYPIPSRILLVLTFILLSIRILNMFSLSEYLGPKLVIIQKMFKDTFAFLIILSVIMMSFSVSFHSLNHQNSEFGWAEIERVMQHGFWMLLEPKQDDEPECTIDTVEDICPTVGQRIAPYLKAFYGLIAVILLLNLLIAIYR